MAGKCVHCAGGEDAGWGRVQEWVCGYAGPDGRREEQGLIDMTHSGAPGAPRLGVPRAGRCLRV